MILSNCPVMKYTALFRVPTMMYGINLRINRIPDFDYLFFKIKVAE
jgi:hypothetical protein